MLKNHISFLTTSCYQSTFRFRFWIHLSFGFIPKKAVTKLHNQRVKGENPLQDMMRDLKWRPVKWRGNSRNMAVTNTEIRTSIEEARAEVTDRLAVVGLVRHAVWEADGDTVLSSRKHILLKLHCFQRMDVLKRHGDNRRMLNWRRDNMTNSIHLRDGATIWHQHHTILHLNYRTTAQY